MTYTFWCESGGIFCCAGSLDLFRTVGTFQMILNLKERRKFLPQAITVCVINVVHVFVEVLKEVVWKFLRNFYTYEEGMKKLVRAKDTSHIDTPESSNELKEREKETTIKGTKKIILCQSRHRPNLYKGQTIFYEKTLS